MLSKWLTASFSIFQDTGRVHYLINVCCLQCVTIYSPFLSRIQNNIFLWLGPSRAYLSRVTLLQQYCLISLLYVLHFSTINVILKPRIQKIWFHVWSPLGPTWDLQSFAVQYWLLAQLYFLSFTVLFSSSFYNNSMLTLIRLWGLFRTCQGHMAPVSHCLILLFTHLCFQYYLLTIIRSHYNRS